MCAGCGPRWCGCAVLRDSLAATAYVACPLRQGRAVGRSALAAAEWSDCPFVD